MFTRSSRCFKRRPSIIGIAAVFLMWAGFHVINKTSNIVIETMKSDQIFAASFRTISNTQHLDIVNCTPGIPCRYPERVDFRVIVLTFNRDKSLQRLLKTLDTVVLDGDSARLEIWIDRGRNGSLDSRTLKVASEFNWTRGPTRVHIQQTHVGLYGQWIDTWIPHDQTKNSTEIAVILEDDLLVSPFIYRWLKAVHRHYGQKPEFFGATLVSDEPRGKESKRPHMINHKKHTVYYHKYPDTWGLSPSPYHWNLFQQWFHRTYPSRTDFKPYVEGTIFTEWYQVFEKSGTAKNMWSMWIIYYTNSQQLFTVYNNLGLYTNSNTTCLAINKREPGLHYSNKVTVPKPYCKLLTEWNYDYTVFPNKTVRVDWKGKQLKHYFQ